MAGGFLLKGGLAMNTSPPWLSPGTWTVCGAAVIAAEGHLVQVIAVHSDDSQEPIRLTGLQEISVFQTRDRVRAAIVLPVKSAC